MSRKTKLSSDMNSHGKKCGGATLTKKARQSTIRKFIVFLMRRGFTNILGLEQVRVKHVKLYIEMRLAQNGELRTLQNEMSHLRGILKDAGCVGVLNSPELTNANLGLAGASRAGTNKAMSPEEYERVRALAFLQNRPGMAALVDLERYLGLRGNEAIHAKTDTLERWLRELHTGGTVEVIAGTKGGRRRTVHPVDVQAAIRAVEEALAVAKRQESHLVVREDGSAAGGLKQSRSIYHGWAVRAGFKPHAARYAFARAQVDGYKVRGMTEREAFVATALDLGHGDGRGRFVRSIYCRG
jgi:Integrase/Phage integrase, N-terminal